MYGAFVIFLVGTTLLLGSWFGWIVGLILVIGVAIRAVQEERTLRAELPGYTAYLAQVKYHPHSICVVDRARQAGLEWRSRVPQFFAPRRTDGHAVPPPRVTTAPATTWMRDSVQLR
jgi:hypothetical protein